ncbi:mucin-7-like [Panicum virgatum]|uniref:mucin-7-like n=1 Tax=Panicum virgatum TaxID=38727 RepID=UPI0019D533B0|nr:mucin-7-like [Panicum virgatum]
MALKRGYEMLQQANINTNHIPLGETAPRSRALATLPVDSPRPPHAAAASSSRQLRHRVRQAAAPAVFAGTPSRALATPPAASTAAPPCPPGPALAVFAGAPMPRARDAAHPEPGRAAVLVLFSGAPIPRARDATRHELGVAVSVRLPRSSCSPAPQSGALAAPPVASSSAPPCSPGRHAAVFADAPLPRARDAARQFVSTISGRHR